MSAYAAGELPAWAQAGERRRAHMARVAGLMEEWAAGLGLSQRDRLRWRVAGWLHDSLRDADPEVLRAELPGRYSKVPGKFLHGPAAAGRLSGELDAEVCDAIRHHTLGSPELGRLGRALHLADSLDPGRPDPKGEHGALRASLPRGAEDALPVVLSRQIGRLLEERRPLAPETVAFWNSLAAKQ